MDKGSISLKDACRMELLIDFTKELFKRLDIDDPLMKRREDQGIWGSQISSINCFLKNKKAESNLYARYIKAKGRVYVSMRKL